LPAADLPLLIEAARIAGRVATSFTGPTAARWDKPGDAGPVTEADLAVNDLLMSNLRAARPTYGWLSEETDDTTERLDHETVFIVDPIDGTRNFVEGGRTWAISIAVAHKGEITAAAIYLPLRDKMYGAAKGMGATLNQLQVTVASPSPTRTATVLAAVTNLEPHHWPGGVPQLTRHYRPSLAYRLSLVGEGRFDGMLTLRPSWEWDIAAGALIVSEAGGQITDQTGTPLKFNNESPMLNGVVAATKPLHDNLIWRLTHA
jgi:myo-inositol-1(or 4)-monophosphatase